MSQAIYHLLSYQLSPINAYQTSIDNPPLSNEARMRERNQFLRRSFGGFEKFKYRNKDYDFKILSSDSEAIILKVANRKKVILEKDFQPTEMTTSPSVTVIFLIGDLEQQILIERGGRIFNWKTLKLIIQENLNYSLKQHGLILSIDPQFSVSDFWQLVEKNKGKINRIDFGFHYPNCPRINKTVSSELKEATKSIGASKAKISFAAEGDQTLNLDDSNEQINSLVDASSEGAGPIKMGIQGKRIKITTEKITKTVEFDGIDVGTDKKTMKSMIKDLLKFLD